MMVSGREWKEMQALTRFWTYLMSKRFACHDKQALRKKEKSRYCLPSGNINFSISLDASTVVRRLSLEKSKITNFDGRDVSSVRPTFNIE